MKKVLFFALALLLFMGVGFALAKARLNATDDSDEYIYKVDNVMVVHAVGEEKNYSYYRSLHEAIAAAESGDTVKLLSNVVLDNVTDQFVIDKSLTIDGAKADGSGNYKIEADFGDTAGKLFVVSDSSITLTLENFDVTLSGTHNETNIVDNACNVVVENSHLISSKRAIRISAGNGTLLVTNSTIEGGTMGIGAFGNGKRKLTVTDNSTIKGGSSAIDLSGGENEVTITGSKIYSENFPIQIYKGTQTVTLGNNSVVERRETNGHAIYTHGVGSVVTIALEGNAYVSGVEDSDIYFTVNTASYSVKFSENYARYATCSGAPHSSGSGGCALRFFDNLQDAVNSSFEYLFTYNSDAIDEFIANGYSVDTVCDSHGVTYYKLVA